MIKLFFLKGFYFCILLFSLTCKADIIIKSNFETNLLFTDKKEGGNYDRGSWGKIIFIKNKAMIDLSKSERIYASSDYSELSPSGIYLKVNSINRDYLSMKGKPKNAVDKTYCTIIDMRNGCIITDWDGEICGYEWKINEDVLTSADNTVARDFNFISLRPNLGKVKKSFSLLSKFEVKNLLRCDEPSKENITIYKRMAEENKENSILIKKSLRRVMQKSGEYQ